jgi:hypothetical protein
MSSLVTIPLPQEEMNRVLSLQVTITSPETLEKAQVNLSAVRKASKDLTAAVKALKAPHQEAIKEIDAAAKPWKDKLDQRDAQLETGILAYHRQVREEAQKKQLAEQAKYEKKVERVEAKALAEGKPVPVVLPPPIISAPPKTMQVGESKQTVMKRKAWKISAKAFAAGLSADGMTAEQNRIHELGIPERYFTLDTGAIGKIVRAGGTVPGVEVYEEESLSIRG